MEAQTTHPSLPANSNSDVTSAASFGGSSVKSDYVELAEKSPTSPANILDLAGHISKLEAMRKVLDDNGDFLPHW